MFSGWGRFFGSQKVPLGQKCLSLALPLILATLASASGLIFYKEAKSQCQKDYSELFLLGGFLAFSLQALVSGVSLHLEAIGETRGSFCFLNGVAASSLFIPSGVPSFLRDPSQCTVSTRLGIGEVNDVLGIMILGSGISIVMSLLRMRKRGKESKQLIEEAFLCLSSIFTFTFGNGLTLFLLKTSSQFHPFLVLGLSASFSFLVFGISIFIFEKAANQQLLENPLNKKKALRIPDSEPLDSSGSKSERDSGVFDSDDQKAKITGRSSTNDPVQEGNQLFFEA